MTNEPRVLGELSVADGQGVVRITERVDVGPDAVWAALTETARLAVWIGAVEGDLREGGELHAHWDISGWEGVERIERCEPLRRLLLAGHEEGDTADQSTEVTLAPTQDGGTEVVATFSGIPVAMLAGYATGNQLHVEDLAGYLAGREREDVGSRFEALMPRYQVLAERL